MHAALDALDLTNRPTTSGRSPRRGSSQTRVRSLAVLPLENLSPAPDDDYFADGMTDALITTLAQLSGLRVISRTSVMRYKGTRRPLPEIARELNVDAIVEGTVLRSHGRVRIGTQLIHAASDTHLWSKQYETDLRDVLALQSDVARSIADGIQLQLSPQQKSRLAGSRPVDPVAYENFLKGRHLWFRRSPDALKKAVEYLQQAINLDPSHALAHAGLADAYVSMGWDLFGLSSPSENYPKARDAAQRALEIDPNCAEAHAALGCVAAQFDWDWSTGGAGSLGTRLISSPNTGRPISGTHISSGPSTEQRNRLRRAAAHWSATRSDSCSTCIWVGTWSTARQYEKAIEQC